jgi:hypothetical protein
MMHWLHTNALNSALKVLFVLCAIVCSTTLGFAQPEFLMRDTMVTDCEGVLFDSELGELTGHYAHNEDYVFTICIAGADDIVLDFTYFHTETHDEITFYDGPDTGSPVISGPYSGRTSLAARYGSDFCTRLPDV